MDSRLTHGQNAHLEREHFRAEDAAKERALLSVPVDTNVATLKQLTTEQTQRLGFLVEGYAKRLSKVTVHRAGPLDLPDGWVTFRLDFSDGYGPIYGGISPEGDCHT